jgi:hypothetical protein
VNAGSHPSELKRDVSVFRKLNHAANDILTEVMVAPERRLSLSPSGDSRQLLGCEFEPSASVWDARELDVIMSIDLED